MSKTSAPRKADTVRTRDPERTQSEILAVAVREFAEHGLHGARVDRIAKAAKCNARMLYHYFGNKEQLYLAALDSVFASIRNQEAALNLNEGEPREMAQKLVEFTFDHFATNSDFVKLTRNENMLGGKFIRRSHMIRDMSQPLIASIGKLVERGHASGAFRHKPDPLNLYLTIVALSGHHLNNAATLGAVFGRDLTAPDWLQTRRAHAVAVVMDHLGAEPA